MSGHLDLGKATNAPIIFGPGTSTSFPVHVAKDGETFRIGDRHYRYLYATRVFPNQTFYLEY